MGVMSLSCSAVNLSAVLKPLPIIAGWTEVQGACLKSDKPFHVKGPYTVFAVVHAWPGGIKGNAGLIGWGDHESDPRTGIGLRLKPGPTVLQLPLSPGRTSIETFWATAEPLSFDDEAPVSFSRAVLLETSFDGTEWQMRLNGNELTARARVVGTNSGKGPLTIGQVGDGDYFRGDIAEIVIYDRAVYDAERAQIEEYFSSRYALWQTIV